MVYKFIKDINPDEKDEEVINIFRRTIAPGWIKFSKKHYNEVVDRVTELQQNIGAGMNINRDIQDDRYKYNNLRTKLIDQRKRKEAREADKKF